MAKNRHDSSASIVARPVFIIGTGRSGTHWLGRSLAVHREIRATIETPTIFNLSTRMAINQPLENQLFGHLIDLYQSQLAETETKFYLDKSHPNLWLAEKLKNAFNQSLFLGIERSPYATIASMLRHPAVSSWHRRWREFPVPNRFLGITSKNKDRYGGLTLAEQCALRWVAHHNRMTDLREILRSDLLFISYEQFARDVSATIESIETFFDLSEPITAPVVKTDSVNKWRMQLSNRDIADIRRIVGIDPDFFESAALDKRIESSENRVAE